MKKLVKLFISVWAVSCSSSTSNAPTIADAWTKFESKDYPGALQQFIGLTSDNNVAPEANTGAGWCSLRLYDYASANSYFANASSEIDSRAGSSFSQWALGNNADAIVKADLVLTASPAYTFAHDMQITAAKLVLIKAHAYYELAQYDQCLAMIKQLEPSYNATIAPADSAQVLLAKLTSLGPVS